MPPWFDDVLRQSPILAAALLVAWVTFRYIAKQHEEHLKALRANYQEALRLLTDAYDKHLASKDGEINRLQKEIAAMRRAALSAEGIKTQ